jgi:hypothetical protein
MLYSMSIIASVQLFQTLNAERISSSGASGPMSSSLAASALEKCADIFVETDSDSDNG